MNASRNHMSAFHDQFEVDAEYPNWHHWTTAKPLFQHAAVTFVPPYRKEPDGRDEIEVTAFCENGNEFGEFHQRAWSFITNNAAAVEANLRRKLFVHHLRGYRGFVEECVPDFDDYEVDEWNKIKNAIDWDTLDAVNDLYELSSIGLLDDGLDDCGYISIGNITMA
jgi:hypothetical protein